MPWRLSQCRILKLLEIALNTQELGDTHSSTKLPIATYIWIPIHVAYLTLLAEGDGEDILQGPLSLYCQPNTKKNKPPSVAQLVIVLERGRKLSLALIHMRLSVWDDTDGQGR
jgi:hypothetical protein